MENQPVIAEASAVEPAQGIERRRNRRFPCSGLAEGLFHQPEILFRGELRDVSLTGCMILTRAHLHVQVLSLVELRFQVNNNHYRTRARVIEIRNGQGVGMEFIHEDVQAVVSFQGLIQTLHYLSPQAPAAG
jgi:hypothetical protein